MTVIATMVTPPDFKAFPWMEHAFRELGTREIATTKRNNPRILAYHATSCGASDDETAWCSSFANWCMKQAGMKGTGKPNARSWLQWGESLPVHSPVYGCVTVFSRPPKAWQGHVAFFVGMRNGAICVLGGNQGPTSGAVCLKDYPLSRLMGFRWPTGFPRPA
ncbi:MAG TPA: TIGR02594 family protein [Polyangiaceae bacterium]|nr:TIGR02594 family protein [Polyangiaceae bacterium]